MNNKTQNREARWNKFYLTFTYLSTVSIYNSTTCTASSNCISTTRFPVAMVKNSSKSMTLRLNPTYLITSSPPSQPSTSWIIFPRPRILRYFDSCGLLTQLENIARSVFRHARASVGLFLWIMVPSTVLLSFAVNGVGVLLLIDLVMDCYCFLPANVI